MVGNKQFENKYRNRRPTIRGFKPVLRIYFVSTNTPQVRLSHILHLKGTVEGLLLIRTVFPVYLLLPIRRAVAALLHFPQRYDCAVRENDGVKNISFLLKRFQIQ